MESLLFCLTGTGAGEDFIHNPVLYGFFRGHDEVAIGVSSNLVQRLTGVTGEDVVELRLDPEDFFGMNLDV